jgi:hypothetical protein
MLNRIIDFFLNIPKDTWRDVVLSSMLIPLSFYSATKLRIWLESLRPKNSIFHGYKSAKNDILIFLSQLSAADDQQNMKTNQKYITSFPKSLPNNRNHLETQNYINIDPIWSQSDGLCATQVFNILGQINKYQDFRVADTIIDWNKRSNPIFTIGFNPKTIDLINSCAPINFQLNENGTTISLKEHMLILDAIYPNDAGIIQKTFISNTNIPVFILAGLGTTGTEVAGKVLNQNCVALGKLYGNKSFCLLFRTEITKGSSYYDLKCAYPKPQIIRALFYPVTYIKWYKKKLFLKS